jgi:(R,R)-butanediol dehydrogenase/meso-butanediol dehydrogenase/diacetyl reductase/L-iditol 2-dehydrogenase
MKLVACVEQGDPAKKTMGKVACIEWSKPELRSPEDVLIRIMYSSICGSDPHVLTGHFPVPLPKGLGHEMSGIIEALGSKATKNGLKVGDRVTGNFVKYCGSCYYCRNGMENLCSVTFDGFEPTQTEYVVWHESQVYKIPEGVDLMDAALTEPTAISLHMVEQAQIKLGSRVAISGAGGLGLLILQLVRIHGASSVTVIEPSEEKRKLAMLLGADQTIDPYHEDVYGQAMELTNELGYDAVFETSVSLKAAEISLSITGRAGHVVFSAKYPKEACLSLHLFRDCYFGEKHIHGSLMSAYSYPRVISLLPRLNLKAMIQRVYKLEECEQAYSDQLDGNFAKIVFQCQPE